MKATYFKGGLKSDFFTVGGDEITAAGTNTTQATICQAGGGLVTTGALTTAASGTTDIEISIAGLSGNAIGFAKVVAGGTNTRAVSVNAVDVTDGLLTITIKNTEESSALNGTVKVSFMVLG